MSETVERARVLIVDDHPEMVRLLRDRLSEAGLAVDAAGGGAEAIERARATLPDVVLTDLRMEDVDGLDVLAGVHAVDAGVPVIVMTAFGGVESAVEAMKRGAFDYITKPFNLEALVLQVERALSVRRLRSENASLRRVAEERASLGGMIGTSAAMRTLFSLVERAAASPAPVLVRGESGTGKELVARALHFSSPRRAGPYVPVNCTTLPEQLLESELFGHAKGAFTGAQTARRGLFIEADGGTLFLDEIGDMPLPLQAKLLRVLQDGSVRPVGANVARTVDVRIVAASHQPLEKLIDDGRFRADLLFRLNVVPLTLPSLRDRLEDVPALAERFLARAVERNPHARARAFAPEVLGLFLGHAWPGNVRELENLIERLVVLSPGETIGAADVAAHAPLAPAGPGDPLARAKNEPVPLRQLERDYIAYVVERCGGNKTRAAEILGIDVSTIHRKDKER